MDKGKEKRGKKRNKSYYLKSSQQKRVKLNKLDAGMSGFLVTCNRDEKQAVREMYNILNEYADILYGVEQQQPASRADGCDDDSEENSDDDMEKAMHKEVKVIQESQMRPRRFQNCYTNAKNCIFISTSLENPTELAHKIFTDLAVKKTQKTRFAMRLLPVSGTCKAYVEDMKKLAEQILSPHFTTPVGESKTYGIVFRVRNNNSVSRQVVLPMIGQLIADMNPLNRVHLDNPDLVVLVEVVCGVCCMSVVKDFYKFRKYNFHEVIKDTVGPARERNAAKIDSLETIVEKTAEQIGNADSTDEKHSKEVGNSKSIEDKTSKEVGDSKNRKEEGSKEVGDSKSIEEKTSVQIEDSETIEKKTKINVCDSQDKEENSTQAADSKSVISKTSVQNDGSKNATERQSNKVESTNECDKKSTEFEESGNNCEKNSTKTEQLKT